MLDMVKGRQQHNSTTDMQAAISNETLMQNGPMVCQVFIARQEGGGSRGFRCVELKLVGHVMSRAQGHDMGYCQSQVYGSSSQQLD